jgi:hypothetical protein
MVSTLGTRTSEILVGEVEREGCQKDGDPRLLRCEHDCPEFLLKLSLC